MWQLLNLTSHRDPITSSSDDLTLENAPAFIRKLPNVSSWRAYDISYLPLQYSVTKHRITLSCRPPWFLKSFLTE